jgi:hypothetical protein
VREVRLDSLEKILIAERFLLDEAPAAHYRLHMSQVVKPVFAEGRSMARGPRLEEIRGIRTAVLLVMSRVDMVLAYCRPAKASPLFSANEFRVQPIPLTRVTES